MLQIFHIEQVLLLLLEKIKAVRLSSPSQCKLSALTACRGSPSGAPRPRGRRFFVPFPSSLLAPGATNVQFNSFLRYHMFESNYLILTSVLSMAPSVFPAPNTHTPGHHPQLPQLLHSEEKRWGEVPMRTRGRSVWGEGRNNAGGSF